MDHANIALPRLQVCNKTIFGLGQFAHYPSHTHETIDGCFGYLSKKLKEENNYILANLMRAFMISQERLFIPQLIQENSNFKSWVLGCLKDGLETLVGHSDMYMFRFLLIP
jgi:hypothetical protein